MDDFDPATRSFTDHCRLCVVEGGAIYIDANPFRFTDQGAMNQAHIKSKTLRELRQIKRRCRADPWAEIVEITCKTAEIGFGLTKRRFCSRHNDVGFRPTNFGRIGQDRASKKPSAKRLRPTL